MWGCHRSGSRRIREGAAMIRTKGEAGTGNIIEAVRHVRSVMGDVRVLANMDDDEVFTFAKKIGAPYDLVMQTKQLGRLPVVQFAAGGVATPADAALMMQSGTMENKHGVNIMVLEVQTEMTSRDGCSTEMTSRDGCITEMTLDVTEEEVVDP